MLLQAKHTGFGVAGLRTRRDGTDFDEAKAHRRQRIDVFAILVQSRGQPDRVAEFEPHHFNGRGYAGTHQLGKMQFLQFLQRTQRKVMRELGIECEQGGTG